MPKFDSRWNAPVRLIFRILAFLLSILMITMGSLALIDKIGSTPIEFDSTFKIGIAGIGWGIILLIIAIRGRFLKKNF